MTTLKTINLEAGMPTIDEARRRLIVELNNAKRAGVHAIKLIHGYGSTGVGGALQPAIRRSLRLRQKEGIVLQIIFGEKWDIFEKATQGILETIPELRRDSDLQRGNPGITIVILKSDHSEG